MNSKNKFVFESFQDFVEQVLEKVKTGQLNEEEGYNSLISSANQIIGDLKLKGEAKTMATEFFQEMSKYIAQIPDDKIRPEAIKEIQGDIEGICDAITTSLPQGVAKAVLDTTKTGWKREYVEGTYAYSYAGTVLVNNSADWVSNAESDWLSTNGPQNLSSMLGALNAYNLDVLYNVTITNSAPYIKGPKFKEARKQVEALSEVDGFLIIEDLDVNTIDVKRSLMKSSWTVDEEAGEIGVTCPLYSVAIFQPGAGEPIIEEMIEEVIQPAGTSVEVVEKKHSSEGVDFFAQNEVKISEAGIKALKAMISQYNSISKIIVNGAASSKPTSRAGGNEQLAQDRRASGIAELNTLKKTAPQLKNAQILEGTAEVQQGPKEESDPKMQQVSFIVSGTAKKSEIVDNKEVKITKIENIKGDNIRLWKNKLTITLKGWAK